MSAAAITSALERLTQCFERFPGQEAIEQAWSAAQDLVDVAAGPGLHDSADSRLVR